MRKRVMQDQNIVVSKSFIRPRIKVAKFSILVTQMINIEHRIVEKTSCVRILVMMGSRR